MFLANWNEHRLSNIVFIVAAAYGSSANNASCIAYSQNDLGYASNLP
jgi:hypothetical protein